MVLRNKIGKDLFIFFWLNFDAFRSWAWHVFMQKSPELTCFVLVLHGQFAGLTINPVRFYRSPKHLSGRDHSSRLGWVIPIKVSFLLGLCVMSFCVVAELFKLFMIRGKMCILCLS